MNTSQSLWVNPQMLIRSHGSIGTPSIHVSKIGSRKEKEICVNTLKARGGNSFGLLEDTKNRCHRLGGDSYENN